MTVRTATAEDCAAILDVAERSFRASYALSPEQIETILQEVFAESPLAARIADDGCLVVVAENEGNVVGFADCDVEAGTLRWLHVDPYERGAGIGTSLFGRVVEELSGRDEPLTAHILDEAAEGDGFLRQFGLYRSDTRPAGIGNGDLSAHIYTGTAREIEANVPAVVVPARVSVDGTALPVGRDERIPGTEAPFFPTYTGTNRGERHGFFCSSCGSTDVSADNLDRLECGNCGNKHRADDWDDAYL